MKINAYYYSSTGTNYQLAQCAQQSVIETIIVTGVWTNMAVEHTCRDGADHGYNVVIATDGTSTIGE